jgi:uncharacterized protein (DUF1501 family)
MNSNVSFDRWPCCNAAACWAWAPCPRLSLAAPGVWAQPVPAGRQGLDGGRLIVVFLRGAYDGLSAFVPYADKDYYAMRPNIAIAAPDGTAQTAIKLDKTFALHPALSPLMPLWQQGVLGFVPAAGLPAPNRSHFDAQYQMEIAQSGKTSSAPGWLNTTAALAKPPAPAARLRWAWARPIPPSWAGRPPSG